MTTELQYMTGFGNEFATQARPGVLPSGQNSPQEVADGLFAEQLSGTAFTVARARNQRSWLYRLRPSVRHLGRLVDDDPGLIRTGPNRIYDQPVEPQRFNPLDDPAGSVTWLRSLTTVATCGDPNLFGGAAIHLYAANEPMIDTGFVNADGELLIVPQRGGLRFVTELGVLDAGVGEIAVIPRGVKFRVELDGLARGYVCENYGPALSLPEPGPIGVNAMAMPRDFLTPVAAFEEVAGPFSLYFKWRGRLLRSDLEHSPLDVVAWHGNYAPYKYELRNYCAVGPVVFDHPDPSIWTLLTSPSDTPGMANLDFVLFRDRWVVAEHSFRPPWFHSNIMSEVMGLIEGAYDAKQGGFLPGGLSVHNAFVPHGPDAETYQHASTVDLVPERMEPTLAVMFETRFAWDLTEWAINTTGRQPDYADCWDGLEPVD